VEVTRAARLLNVDLGQVFELVTDPSIPQVQKPSLAKCTIKHALAHYLELTSVPRRALIAAFVQFCIDDKEKERMTILACNEEGLEEYNTWVKNSNRTIIEVLEAFPSCKIPFEFFMENIPKLQPRYYSISSSMSIHPHSVHLTAVIVNYVTGTNRVHEGVCTTFLNKCKVGDKLPIFIRTSVFKLPKDVKKPVIMIGPGTGLAPFRGFIQELEFRKRKSEIGTSILFFGCRREDEDYIYRDELEAARDNMILTYLYVGFSRQFDHKVYVQDMIRNHHDDLWKLFEEGACIYVCGDAKQMAKDVHKELKQVVVSGGLKSEKEAESYILQLQTSGRYLQDTWT